MLIFRETSTSSVKNSLMWFWCLPTASSQSVQHLLSLHTDGGASGQKISPNRVFHVCIFLQRWCRNTETACSMTLKMDCAKTWCAKVGKLRQQLFTPRLVHLLTNNAYFFRFVYLGNCHSGLIIVINLTFPKVQRPTYVALEDQVRVALFRISFWKCRIPTPHLLLTREHLGSSSDHCGRLGLAINLITPEDLHNLKKHRGTACYWN